MQGLLAISDMTTARVLCVGADATLSDAIATAVRQTSGCRYAAAPDMSDLSAATMPDDLGLLLIVTDRMSDSTVRTLDRLRSDASHVPIVVICDEATPAQRLAYFQHGATDCLIRPLNLTRLALLIDILTARKRLTPAPLKTIAVEPKLAELGFAFQSSVMQQLITQVKLAARTDATVLITGETGTGKTHLSRVIHSLSPRREATFLAVNCGALPASLIDSELFGHAQGSFTGADRQHVGKLAQAGEGTLLLDEIDSLPLEAQAKLLRAVEEREFQPVGSTETKRFCARLLVATNSSLTDQVAQGKFRADLYYRLNVVRFTSPALRERPDDLRCLAVRFLAEACSRMQLIPKQFGDSALQAMAQYSWPGNIRELRNVIERLAVLCPHKVIEDRHLPTELYEHALPAPHASEVIAEVPVNRLSQARQRAEQTQLMEALQRHQNNRSLAAIELGISRAALYKKLHRFGLM